MTLIFGVCVAAASVTAISHFIIAGCAERTKCIELGETKRYRNVCVCVCVCLVFLFCLAFFSCVLDVFRAPFQAEELIMGS